MDYTLKFESQEQAQSILYRKEGVVEVNEELGIEANEGYDVANYDNIDVIGTIYKPTGAMLKNEEGMDYPEMKAIDGYHVNIRNYTEAPELDAYAVNVSTPSRIWG
jgi:hypothetical protein